MRQKRILGSVMLLLTVVGLPASAQDWANWRGPNYNGATEQVGIPTHFSRTENVKWVVEMPGPSAATPIVWKNSVFVSSTDLKAQNLVAMCLDRKTGKVKWQFPVSSGYQAGGAGNKLQLDERSNYASPSPVTDGKVVVFFYGNGDLVCFTPEGKKLWARNVQKDYGDFAFQWTFSSSPQLYAGKLYLQILQRDQSASGRGKDGGESFLLAMEPSTGKQLWKYVRPTTARMESREAYSTPIPYTHNGRKELLIAGGDMVSGHDPETGKELWRWGTWNPEHREMWWRLVPSPVAGNGVVVVCAPKRAPVFATKLGGVGSLGDAGLAWKSEEKSAVTSDVPTPLFYHGKFYVLSDVKRALSCVEPSSGKAVWSTPIPCTPMCWTSPTGADGKIYLMSVTGQVFVLDAATGKILADIPMAQDENDIRSSLPVAYGNLFVRTNTKLYCIGK